MPASGRESPGNSARGLISAVAFYIVSVLVFPVTLIGYVLLTVFYFLAVRSSGVSGIAHAPLMARWYQHGVRTRQDEPADRLLSAVSRVPLAMTLAIGPVVLA